MLVLVSPTYHVVHDVARLIPQYHLFRYCDGRRPEPTPHTLPHHCRMVVVVVDVMSTVMMVAIGSVDDVMVVVVSLLVVAASDWWDNGIPHWSVGGTLVR